MRKKSLFLLWAMVLAALFSSLCACKKNPYTVKTASVPAEWPIYTLGSCSFRFEAGFKQADFSPLTDSLAYLFSPTESENKLTTVVLFASPTRDIGTVDYLTLGFYQMNYVVNTDELLSLKDSINNMDITMTEGQFKVSVEQSASLAQYGSVVALTYSLLLQHGEVNCCMQVALFAKETKLYQAIYCDFSTAKDNEYLERFLSSFTFC